MKRQRCAGRDRDLRTPEWLLRVKQRQAARTGRDTERSQRQIDRAWEEMRERENLGLGIAGVEVDVPG